MLIKTYEIPVNLMRPKTLTWCQKYVLHLATKNQIEVVLDLRDKMQ